MTPNRKVGAGALAGALSVVGVFIANTYWLAPSGLPPITGEVGSALTTILTFAVSYFVPEA